MTVGAHGVNVANKWLDVIRTGGASFTAITTAFVKIHVGDPGAAGTSNPSAGSTTRVAVSHNAPSGGSMTITGTAPVWTHGGGGGGSETLSHISVHDNISAGNCLYTGALASGKLWTTGQTFTLSTLTVSIAPIAA